MQSGDLSEGVNRDSLEEFLAKLPNLWRAGDARPIHRKKPISPRYWRTREDPFANVWPEILLWLQEDPDAMGITLLRRLQEKYPGQFLDGQVRTLQRRIRHWRQVTAHALVHACLNGNPTSGEPAVIGAGSKT